MPNSVRVFQSTDSGAPALSGTAGTLIAVLDACLTNGYGAVTIDTLVVASNVATVTDSSGHGFTAIGTVGPVIRIAGATPAGLNGDWRITYVSATQFTFATTGISDQTASGTITAKRAPLGFSKLFTGTANKCAYRSDDVTGTRMYLRVDDSGTTSARVRGYSAIADQAALDADTATDPYPTNTQYSGGGYWGKSSAASATARAWRIVGDSRGFMVWVNQSATVANSIAVYFGDFASEKTADAYGSVLYCGVTTTVENMGTLVLINGSTSIYIPRSHTQIGTSIAAVAYTHKIQANYLGGTGITYPSAVGNQFYAAPVELWESLTIFRGILPGIWCPLHPGGGLTDAAIISDMAGLSGHSLQIDRCGYAGAAVAISVDISGPWR